MVGVLYDLMVLAGIYVRSLNLSTCLKKLKILRSC